MKFFRLFLFFISLFSLATSAFAAVSLSVKNEEIARTKILFIGFEPEQIALQNEAKEIFERVRKNLATTDLFEVVKQARMANPLEEMSVEAVPDFEKYVKSGIGAILVGQFNFDQAGNLELRIRMWDVLDSRQLFGKFYTASRDNYRKVSNLVSDEIFKAITGEKIGHFSSKILYVSEHGSATRRSKKISMIDFDGENRRVLTDGRELVLTPIFTRRSDEIFYLRYFEGKPQVFSLNIDNLRTKKLGGFRETTLSPSVHPKDSNLLLLSAISDGNSDIFELNIAANSAKKLTRNPAIDTTPSYSPDGKSIAFSSDRDGGQQIYVMDSNGDSVRRISSGSGSYSKPVFSPDGKMIAFTKIKNGQFSIGVMLANGGGEKMLVSAYLVEGAKWSPSGRYLIYSKKRGVYGQDSIPRLFIIDIVTGFEIEIPTPVGEGASDPDWA